MEFPYKIVRTAVELYNSGLSLHEVRKRIWKIFNILVKSTSTIWYWAQRLVRRGQEKINGLAEMLHVDETKLKTAIKGRYLWFWAVKDPNTRTIVGWHVSEHRTLEDAKKLFWNCRRSFPAIYFPKVIRTDGWPGYRTAIRKVFGFGVKHDKFLSFKEHSNNMIECFFRCKRKFPRFRNINAARNFINNWVVEYNEEKLGDAYNFCLNSIIRILKTIVVIFIKNTLKL
jgi:transposase-like protein